MGCLGPCGGWSEEKKRIPNDGALVEVEPDELLVLLETSSDLLIGIPEMRDTRIRHQFRIPTFFGITEQHVEPDRGHLDVRVRIDLEDVRLDPTGPCHTYWSGRRQQKNQPRTTCAFVELCSQLIDRCDVGEGSQFFRRCRLGAAGHDNGEGDQCQKEPSRHATTLSDPAR